MSEEFAIGTICIGQNFIIDTECNGMECEIIGGLEMHAWVHVATGQFGESLCYDVRWADGCEMPIPPHKLRRKPPKTTDTGEIRIRELFNQSPVKQPEPELA